MQKTSKNIRKEREFMGNKKAEKKNIPLITTLAATLALMCFFSGISPDAQAKSKIKKPGKVTLKSVKISNYNDLTVKWNGVKNANGYQIRYAPAKKKKGKWIKSGSWKTINAGGKVRSRKIKNLKFSSGYIVKVRADRSYTATYTQYDEMNYAWKIRAKEHKYGKYSKQKTLTAPHG